MGRPISTFHGFAGQTEIISTLRAHIDGVRAKNLPLPHTLLQGSSGMGKTELAKAIAKGMGTAFLDSFASRGVKRYQLAQHLAKAQQGDVVFIDEVHALPYDLQELLYPAIDKCQVPEVEDGKIKENAFKVLPPFTLVVATDQPSKLTNALLQRMSLRFTLTRYTDEEMRVIVSNRAASIKLSLAPQAITQIAAAARGVPRRAGHLLTSVHVCLPVSSAEITKIQVNSVLAGLGIDRDNLNKNDRTYLELLARRGGCVGLRTIAQQVGLDQSTVESEIEIELRHRDLIDIAPQGRYLTDAGKQFAQQRGWMK